MPSCSVVGCGYRKAVKEAADRGFKYQSFKLPKDPKMRELWLKQLNRSNYVPTQNTVFCQKHFAEDAFVSEEENFNARNPATNELIYKPARIKIRFKPSTNLIGLNFTPQMAM